MYTLIIFVSTVPKEFKKLFKIDDYGYHNNNHGSYGGNYGGGNYGSGSYGGGSYGGGDASYGGGYNNNNYGSNNYNNNDQYSNQYAAGYGEKYRQADATPATNPVFPSMTIPSIMNTITPDEQIPEMHLPMVTICFPLPVLFLLIFKRNALVFIYLTYSMNLFSITSR